jgi:hypothetical protein
LNAALVFTKIYCLRRNIIIAQLSRVIQMVQIILDSALSMAVVLNKTLKLHVNITNLPQIVVMNIGDLATKCFPISSQFGAPTFFLTFTMSPYWLDFQAMKRGDGSCSHLTMVTIIFRSKLNALMKFIHL